MSARAKRAIQSNVERIQRPVHFRAYRIHEGTLVEPHSHPWDQFVFARNGAMHISLDHLRVVLPPQYGMWVPANVSHSVWAAEEVDLESLYVDCTTSRIEAQRIVVMTQLVREFIHYACLNIPVLYDEQGADGQKVKVLLSLLGELQTAPLHLPFPVDEQFSRMCETIQSAPELKHSLEDWAATMNTSMRTFSRRFIKETGITFHAWKQKLRLLQSLEMLQAAMPITRIALNLGYSSTSAYIHSFKTLFGCTPKKFYGMP